MKRVGSWEEAWGFENENEKLCQKKGVENYNLPWRVQRLGSLCVCFVRFVNNVLCRKIKISKMIKTLFVPHQSHLNSHTYYTMLTDWKLHHFFHTIILSHLLLQLLKRFFKELSFVCMTRIMKGVWWKLPRTFDDDISCLPGGSCLIEILFFFIR